MLCIRNIAILSLLSLPVALMAADTSSYQCEGGQKIQLAFPDQNHAIMSYAGELVLLKCVEATSGARYIGGGWQLWGKGNKEVNLASLGKNELFAKDKGITCTRIK